jgi:cytochrome P450 PksS
MRERIETLAERLLDSAMPMRSFDLIREYALPIPTTVIAEMLGVPIEDSNRFHRWTKAIVSSNASGPGTILIIPHVWAFLRYIRRLIRAKRQSPQDDLLTAIVQVEEAGERLSEEELMAMVFLLLVAGHETTVNLIGNGTLALLQNPEQLERLRADETLIKPAIEELLRFAGPLETATERYAREPIEAAGVEIPQGAMVFAGIASANRDERQFPNPDALDVSRDPNKHLSFGLGPHYCLGAPLARLEAQIAIAVLLRRAANLRLAVPEQSLRWRRGLVLRGLQSLAVTAAP